MAQADIESAGSAPHLNQAEQNLLLNALKSNQPKGTVPAGTLNPEATFNSHADSSLFDNLDDTSFLDSHFDTSDLNWDMDPATLAEIQNDNTHTSSHSADGDDASPDEHSGDKRKDRSEADTPDEEGGKRRRESLEKVAKKPGRKPMTNEPTSKRKAQNRAAQRAFRERKEKHLRDLEEKVEELEKSSEATNHENGVLRAQVDRLQAELAEYKKRLPTSRASYSPNQSMNSKFNWDIGQNFDFEFPKFGAGADNALAHKANESSSSNSFTWSPSPLTTTRTMSTSTSVTGNYFNANDLNKVRSPTASTDKSISSESPASLAIGSSVCTTPETCVDSPGQYKGNDKSGSLTSTDYRASASPSQPKTPGQDSLQGVDWFTNQTNGLFDPILISEAYREPQDNILNNADLNLSFFDDAFPWNPSSNYSAPLSNAAAMNSSSSVKPSLMDKVERAAEGKQHDTFAGTMVSDDGKEKHITCAKLWERVQRSEKVLSGQADMDDLCSQLKAKAKCGGPNKGAVVNESDVDAILGPDVTSKTSTSMYGMFK